MIKIDIDTRCWQIPKEECFLGVESDDKVKILQFELSKNEFCDGFNFTDCNCFINYKNEDNDTIPYGITDMEVHEDGTVTFTWKVSRGATIFKGNTFAVLCAKKVRNDGTITNEWNSRIGSFIVAKGLEPLSSITEVPEIDIISQLLLVAKQTNANAQANINQSSSLLEKAEGLGYLKEDFDVLEARMNQFTSLKEGSTTGDAELIDGRIGYDGKVYENIGGAIRGQVSELKGDIVSLEKLVEGTKVSFGKMATASTLFDAREIKCDMSAYGSEKALVMISCDTSVSSVGFGIRTQNGIWIEGSKKTYAPNVYHTITVNNYFATATKDKKFGIYAVADEIVSSGYVKLTIVYDIEDTMYSRLLDAENDLTSLSDRCDATEINLSNLNNRVSYEVSINDADVLVPFVCNIGDTYTVSTKDGSVFVATQIHFLNKSLGVINRINLSASNTSSRTLVFSNGENLDDSECVFVKIIGQSQEISLSNDSFDMQYAMDKLSEKISYKAPKKLNGKWLWTIWDSLGENGWQRIFAENTGCNFETSLNTKYSMPISKGGTTSYPYVDDGTQARALNLLTYKGVYPIDIVMIENINDKALLFNTGTISDVPFMRSQKINVNTNKTSYKEAVEYATQNISDILSGVPLNERKKGTVIAFNYTTGSNICGSKVKFESGATSDGDIIIGWGGNNFSVHVTAGMTPTEIVKAFERYSFGSGTTDIDNGDGSITITYYTVSNIRATFDGGSTGVTATVTDSPAQATYPLYYYGYTSSEWLDTSKWSNNITLYSIYKGLIEYLCKNLPDSKIMWVMPWNVNIDFSSTEYKNADGSWSMDKIRTQSHYQNTIALYGVQKAVCDYYHIQYLDLFSESGMNIFNAENYFYTNNPHPNTDGYKLWADKLSSMVDRMTF